MSVLTNQKLLYLALTSIVSGSVASCGGDRASDPELSWPERRWESVPCDSDNNIDLLTGLNIEKTIDSLTVFPAPVQVLYPLVVGGEPCEAAIQRENCEQEYNAWQDDFRVDRIITTDVDEVTFYEGYDDILNLLGELDSAEKVFLWMQSLGMNLQCNKQNSAVALSDDGEFWYGKYSEITSACAPVVTEIVEVKVGKDGFIEELRRAIGSTEGGVCIGRIPPGELNIVRENADCYGEGLGKMFARHAAFEAASVVAFEHLQRELLYYQAPRSIIEKIVTAANDERRHAQQVSALAEQYGAQSDTFTVDTGNVRSLFDIALDNLKEGCVGETWGALVGLYQAENAQDTSIRKTMKSIAEDEVGHAALSWEIHNWLITKLSIAERDKLEIERLSAINAMRDKVCNRVLEPFEVFAGLPNAGVKSVLMERFTSQLLSAT